MMDQPHETLPPGNRWLIAAAVTIPTFMEVLDTSIANVALRHIAGGLSAAEDDSEWVITSYLAANAIVLPISGWLSHHFGRRNYFLVSVALFTVSSGLCGMATGLSQLSAITVFAAFGALYGALTSLPAMLEVLFGYDATHAGLVMSPSGIFSLLMMPVVSFLLGRRVDARWLVLTGALVMAGGFFWMSRLNLEVSPSQIVWPRVVQAVGTSILFAPLNVAAYMYLPRELRAPAVGLYNLLRNEGGSVGTSVAKTLVERRQQLHLSRLDDELTPFNPNVAEALAGIKSFFLGQTGDPAGAELSAWQVIDNLRQEQALSLSYFDCFWFFAVVSLVLVPLALAMRRSVAEKGAHLAAE